MSSADKFLVTKMLNEIKIQRTSMKTQNAAITDIIEKSNNVLLQIEASRCLKPAINENSSPYTFNKETVNVLTRIVDKFVNLLCDSDHSTESRSFEDYIEECGQTSDYLGSNIRKLLAIWDTVQKMRALLERREFEINSLNESESEDFLE